MACCQQGSLVDDVGQIGAHHSRGSAGNDFQVDVITEFHTLAVNLENRLPAVQVGSIHHHLAIETTRAQQGRVENLRTVGGAHDDHTGAGVETVHLYEQLVQGLLPLVMTADRVEPPHLPQSIELVDEDDAGRLALSLCKEIPHPGGSNPHEHLDELRTGDNKERDSRFPGNRLGQQGLSGARCSHQKYSLRYMAAQVLELLRAF